MTTITIDELATRLREVLDALADGGEPVAVTRGGAGRFATAAPVATPGDETTSDEPVRRP